MVDKRIFYATKKLEIHSDVKPNTLPIGEIVIYENIESSLEPPSQQAKQTGVGEQHVDGRVSAAQT